MRILLIEDDEMMREALTDCLAKGNYAIDAVADGHTAWEYLALYNYDLVVSDVMLPGEDGISFCQELRSQGYGLPVLLLSSRNTSINKIKGLDAGADDFVVKPFDIEELEARIRALLRRGKIESSPVLQEGLLSLDPNLAEATYDGSSLALTPKEYSLLELFLRNHQRVVSYDKIMDSLWSAAESPGKDTVRSHIKELRQKLQFAGAPADAIATVRGQGYRLELLPDEVCPSQYGKTTEEQTSSESQSLQAEFIAAQAKVWEQHKDKFAERLQVLEAASTPLQENSLDRELQQRAEREAHTLAGTLGTFGLAEGSRLARELESLLQQDDLAANAPIYKALSTALRQEMEGTPVEWQQLGPVPSVLVASHDAVLMRSLADKAAETGFRIVTATTLAEASQAISQDPPSVAVLDLRFLLAAEVDDSRGIAPLLDRASTIPIVAYGGNTLDERMEATRLGATLFLKSPATAEQAIETVQAALRQCHSGAKVMIVDDDAELLQGLSTLLEPWGFKLTLVNDPLMFWDVLEAVQPDLLVLDVMMPHVGGIELCQVLRSDPDWNRLPVLFLTARADADIRKQVFAVGADDYVSKPVVAEELANRILNRLSRKQNQSEAKYNRSAYC